MSDKSREELEERVDELEATVKKMLPSRRQVLKSGATVAGAGALGFTAGNASAQASEDDGDGNVGTDDNRVDLFGDGVESRFVGVTDVYASGYGNDGSAIQSALNARGTDPSFVHVDVGVASLSSAPLTVPSNTVVSIEEDVILADSTQENVFQNENHFTDGTDDTNIWFVGNGGRVDGNKANNSQRGSNSTGHGIGSKQNGISLIGVENAVVEGVVVQDCVLHGIGVMGADSVAIRGNRTRGNRYAGVHSHWRETDSRRNHNFNITNNIIEDGGQNAGESAGVYVSGGVDHTVADNIIDTRENFGISVVGKVDTCTNIVISDNIIRDVAGGTSFDPAAGIRLWNSGADLSGVTVTGNTIDLQGATNNDQSGIAVDTAGTYRVGLLTISNNTIRSQSMCISLRGKGGYIENFTVSNNEGTNFNFEFAKGIEVRSAKEGSVSDNIMYECQGSGIIIESTGMTSAKISVVNNLSYDNGRSGSSGDQYGIRLIGTDDTTVMGNKCWSYGNQTYGLHSDSDTTDTVAVLNDFRFNDTGGHNLNGTGEITDAVNQDTTEDWNIT